MFDELEEMISQAKDDSAFILEHGAKRRLEESNAKLNALLDELDYATEKQNSKQGEELVTCHSDSLAVATLKEIAKEAKLQVGLARAIGEGRGIDPTRRERISQFADELETLPAALAQSTKNALQDSKQREDQQQTIAETRGRL